MRSGNDKFFLSRLDRAPGNGKSRVKNEAQTGAKSLSSVISISPTVDGKTLNDRLPLWNATCPASFPKAGVDTVCLVAGGYFEHRLTFKNIHPGKPLTVWKWC